jgi:ABC-type antimicrobial peptide transport system permease subunit
VGVVPDLAMTNGGNPKESGAGIYHATAPGTASPLRMLIHVRGDPTAFTPRLRSIATAVEPNLKIDEPLAVDRIPERDLRTIGFWVRVMMIVSAIALGLSLSGIYSVMAFTVSRRTREIGIRVALGADRRAVIVAIFKRPFIQVTLGVVTGAIMTAVLSTMLVNRPSWVQVATVIGYSTLMLLVCLLACIVPTRRALGVQPTVALKAE